MAQHLLPSLMTGDPHGRGRKAELFSGLHTQALAHACTPLPAPLSSPLHKQVNGQTRCPLTSTHLPWLTGTHTQTYEHVNLPGSGGAYI